jgi:serine/threonine-protein kinase
MSRFDITALPIVEQALEYADIGARAGFVADRCGADRLLRARVDQLLALAGGDFTLAGVAEEVERLRPPAALPDRIGPWRITGELGDGGMGTVLLAERDDGLFAQKVAIKLLHAALRSPRDEVRFRREREILARLDSPLIARILDGGAWEGRPYLVMEFVDGRSLGDYVAQGRPALDRRVALFVDLCKAVQIAHRQLVVHADIKPSNVMVRAGGAIKLLDFGISHVVDEAAGGIALAAADGAPGPLTPAYASPERRAGAPSTVAGDVYSLGAVFHQLLTGDAPDAGGPAEAASAPAGDLDVIAARALAADPADRYPDVASLIADIRAWQHDMPIAARRGQWRYVAGKFVRRHRKGLLVTAGFALALISATAFSLHQWQRAEREQREAQARFNDARGAARYLLFTLMGKLESRPRSLVLREEVAAIAQRYLDRLSTAREAPPSVRLESARGLWQLAAAQAKPDAANLGQTAAAAANLRRAEAQALTLSGPAAARLVARIRVDQVRLAANMEMDVKQADALLAKARSSVAAVSGTEPALVLDLHHAEAEVRIWQGRYAEAEAIMRQAVASAAFAGLPLNARAALLDTLAEAIYYGGGEARALTLYTQAMHLLERAHAARPQDNFILGRLSRARWSVASTYLQIAQPERAVPLLKQATEESARAVAFDPADQMTRRLDRIARAAYAQALGQAHRTDEAIVLLAGQVDSARLALRADPGNAQLLRDFGLANAFLAEANDVARRRDDACAADNSAAQAYAEAQRIGALSKLDDDHNLKLIDERRARNCPASR